MTLAFQMHSTTRLAACARWLRRVVLCLVAGCLGLQGVALSADRALGGTHFHLPVTHSDAKRPDALDGHRYALEIALPTDHQGLQQHEHEAGLSGVVYVADDDSASTLNPHTTLPRSIHDLDVLMRSFGSASDGDAVRPRAGVRQRLFASQISPPLERPPQV